MDADEAVFYVKLMMDSGLSPDEALKEHLRRFVGESPIEISKRRYKCIEISTNMRDAGNRVFRQDKFDDARLVYTMSLCFAPPYSVCAAIAYGNRSAALYHLAQYKECINDIERALSLPHPESLKPKLLSRKQDALAELVANCSLDQETESQNDDRILTHGDNPEAPGLSGGITIAYNEQHGRHLVAIKTFQPGDILVVQQPCAVFMNAEFSMNCHHCLKKSVAPIPCDNCIVLFCSQECRILALKSYHRIDCDFRKYIVRSTEDDVHSKSSSFDLKLSFTSTDQGRALRNLGKELEDVENSEDPQTRGFTQNKFLATSPRAILSLPCPRNATLLHCNAYSAAFMTILLRNETDFFQSNADVELGAKLLMKLRCVVSKNNEDMDIYESKHCLRKALYGFSHMIPHACVSNTISYLLEDKTMVLRACQLIKPGEQITKNYLGRAALSMTTKERQEKILETKEFACRCVACRKNHDFNVDRKQKLTIDPKLQEKLRQNPFDIASMWEVLEIIQRSIPQPSKEAEVMKCNLMNAYMGEKNMMVPVSYVGMGVL